MPLPKKNGKSVDSGAILFVCTGNSCRSPMAEAIARALLPPGASVLSAGVDPGESARLTREVLAEIGIDLNRHRPRSVFRIDPEPVTVVVTMSDAAREHCPLFPNETRRDHWEIPDPFESRGTEVERLHAYRRARDRIGARVRDLLRELQWPVRE